MVNTQQYLIEVFKPKEERSVPDRPEFKALRTVYGNKVFEEIQALRDRDEKFAVYEVGQPLLDFS